MRCLICDTDGNWENVDHCRIKPSGMSICKTCGFVSYPDHKTEDEIKEFYKSEYRAAPSVSNLYSGQRKLHFHEAFLRDIFTEWKKDNKDPVIFEDGAAYGMVLNWMRGVFPNGSFSGSELTTTYKRVAFHEFQLKLDDDFDDSKKYDLIMSYKVAEHQLDVDKKLRKMATSLKDDGLLYISVPCWFHRMYNFGASGFDIEYYYSTSHINAWTRKLFETLLKKCGLEIIKEDHNMYDETYLCKRNDELMKVAPEYEDWKDILTRMEAIKKSYELFEEQKFDEAIAVYPNFPLAHVSRYEMTRKQMDSKGFEKIFEECVAPAIKACPNCADMMLFAADICMRYDKFEEAIKYLEQLLEFQPNIPVALQNLSYCFRSMSNAAQDIKTKLRFQAEATKVTRYLKTISMQAMSDAVNWIYADLSQIPTPYEGEVDPSIIPVTYANVQQPQPRV